ncbi:MAG: transporter substrate-binding domain-containing protein [Deltaproteobacteria bacterium]|nr:transporter substrate-binding domain-containing protein [Deltaproteobacteria bacterium]
MKRIRTLEVMLFILLISIGLVLSTAAVAAEKPGVKVVRVGVNKSFKPIGFSDENGRLTGYDTEVIREVDRRLPEYEFKLEGVDSPSNFLGIDSGKYAFGSSSYFKNAEREKRYLFPEENHGAVLVRIMARKDRNDINSMEDLVGKSLCPHPPADGIYTIIQNWNNTHPDKQVKLVAIDQSSVTPAAALKWVADGRYDAEIIGNMIFYTVQKELNLPLKLTGIVSKNNTYFVFNKSQTELQTKIDQVLREMKKDGTLSKLAIQWIGEDVFKY